ncbi:Signal transduction histidine kinase [Paraburkholderia fungorum]|uniref:histidine kinase n=1 Tax=Paraburkholderia fungorum TaxID=134537 RepID=A0A1H1JHF7_9BURK|nr:ATP-binding protein [Paraburkholderia fungorum]SDR49169.1 Signal transduction histidine kinase [Paraburkholderia fungorum]
MMNKLPLARLLFLVSAASVVLTYACASIALSLLPQVSGFVWMFLAPLLQLILLAVLSSHCGNLISRSIIALTDAANRLGPDMTVRELPEDGPKEIVQAIRAFKGMQQRLARCTAERVQVLAAISHDLQTPITRMRLRAEMLESKQDSARLLQDLDTMHALVEEGVTYARTLHGTTEAPSRIDLCALLQSIVSDYEDSGHNMILDSPIVDPVLTLPHALRRILVNLIDNALKFGSTVQVRASCESSRLVISVLDDGPGIHPDQLEEVFKPFYRGQSCGLRNLKGSGLGLAIARQLAIAMNAELRLANRSGGGLEARLSFGHSPGAVSVVEGKPGVAPRSVDANMAGAHAVIAETPRRVLRARPLIHSTVSR